MYVCFFVCLSILSVTLLDSAFCKCVYSFVHFLLFSISLPELSMCLLIANVFFKRSLLSVVAKSEYHQKSADCRPTHDNMRKRHRTIATTCHQNTINVKRPTLSSKHDDSKTRKGTH